jgi:hypothetical protein
MKPSISLGYEVGTGEPVSVPLHHCVITGQTQMAGKTTTLEAMIARSGLQALTFVTKRGEGSFKNSRRIPPYFRDQADWQFVASILEASRGEKLKFERAWIIRASKGAYNLAAVQANVRQAMKKATGLSADVYLTLDAYLDAVVPQIATVRWADRVHLQPGINVMDLTAIVPEMQHLVIRSSIDWVLNHAQDTVVVVPEAWKFIPQGRGTPVKLAAESYIRQAAGLHNYLWLDSQDIAGVEKIILKSVPVWILGVQREANEVKRTLDQIPAGIKKPKPEQIATLGLGQFYVCHGTTVQKVYVQPAWMSNDEAFEIAMGRAAPTGVSMLNEARAICEPKQEADPMSVEKLDEILSLLRRQPGSPLKPVEVLQAPFTTAVADEDALYQRFKARLINEIPAILHVLVEKPAIHVEYDEKVIEVDGDTLRGRLALLIREGFFDGDGKTGTGVNKELQRRTSAMAAVGTLYGELDELVRLGFLVVEPAKDSKSGKKYQAVGGMKANIRAGDR